MFRMIVSPKCWSQDGSWCKPQRCARRCTSTICNTFKPNCQRWSLRDAVSGWRMCRSAMGCFSALPKRGPSLKLNNFFRRGAVMNYPWLIRLMREDAFTLAPLRLVPSVEVAESEEEIWVRGKDAD